MNGPFAIVVGPVSSLHLNRHSWVVDSGNGSSVTGNTKKKHEQTGDQTKNSFII